ACRQWHVDQSGSRRRAWDQSRPVTPLQWARSKGKLAELEARLEEIKAEALALEALKAAFSARRRTHLPGRARLRLSSF
ncbi:MULTISPECIES: hypothetical protein, partial [unclassified Rhizobium]|uniref:hypothetical protein n=1 Tax=unclassified Rhizobium TaxID=2613769 RepID=UPI00216A7AB0